jgi:hypothetical protein
VAERALVLDANILIRAVVCLTSDRVQLYLAEE